MDAAGGGGVYGAGGLGWGCCVSAPAVRGRASAMGIDSKRPLLGFRFRNRVALLDRLTVAPELVKDDVEVLASNVVMGRGDGIGSAGRLSSLLTSNFWDVLDELAGEDGSSLEAVSGRRWGVGEEVE